MHRFDMLFAIIEQTIKKLGVFYAFLAILLYIVIVAVIVYLMLFVTIHWLRW